jgi:N-acetylmuramoyl-L-alanine amidase
MHAAGLPATPHHAAKVAGEFKQWADRDAGVYYYDDLVVLKTATMPAVLLEAGVILNRDDEPALRSIAMRNRIRAAVADGLARCGALTEAGTSTGAPGNIHPLVTPPADGR